MIHCDLDDMKFYPSRVASKLLIICLVLLRKQIVQGKIDIGH